MSYPVGTEVAGTVSGVTSYGAFVTLPDGSTGMIHISKLSCRFVTDIHAVIKTGDTVKDDAHISTRPLRARRIVASSTNSILEPTGIP